MLTQPCQPNLNRALNLCRLPAPPAPLLCDWPPPAAAGAHCEHLPGVLLQLRHDVWCHPSCGLHRLSDEPAAAGQPEEGMERPDLGIHGKLGGDRQK